MGKIAKWKDYLQANIMEGTTIHSDGLRTYRRLPELGYIHRWVRESLKNPEYGNRPLRRERVVTLPPSVNFFSIKFSAVSKFV